MPKKSVTPRRKRMTKQARLNSAVNWIKKYGGKNIIAGYAKWFGVDKICAINELKSLSVVFPEGLVNQIIASHKLRIKLKGIIQEKKKLRIRCSWNQMTILLLLLVTHQADFLME